MSDCFTGEEHIQPCTCFCSRKAFLRCANTRRCTRPGDTDDISPTPTPTHACMHFHTSFIQQVHMCGGRGRKKKSRWDVEGNARTSKPKGPTTPNTADHRCVSASVSLFACVVCCCCRPAVWILALVCVSVSVPTSPLCDCICGCSHVSESCCLVLCLSCFHVPLPMPMFLCLCL